MRAFTRKQLLPFLLAAAATTAFSQSTTSDILGTVSDASGAVVAGARVTVRNLETNITKESATSGTGSFRVPLLPAGSYEITVEKSGFARYIQGPITLALNQSADLTIALAVAGTAETVNVSTEAPLLNTTNAEIGVNFDQKRIADLPLSTNRNILNLAASVPGVTQLSSGNANFGSGGNQGTETASMAFSANGMRLRSNAFFLDGQDSYYPSTGGLQQPLNNPDLIAEVRILTNQFAPEYGRAAGSVVNIITKGGTNQFHGSAFWFHNNNKLNSLSNLDKAAGFRKAPFRTENLFGGTFGGPVIRDKTFFFVSLQRWTDRRLGSGSSINGAPTEDGRRILSQIAGNRPQVAAFLENLPAGASNGNTTSVNVGGQQYTIPLGSITGSASQRFDDWQYSYRVDHQFNSKHMFTARYLDDDSLTAGTGQVTPSGLTTVSPQKARSASVALNSSFTPTMLNALRVSYSRWTTSSNASNPAVAERIPSIEVINLGIQGINSSPARTGIGLAINLPQGTVLNNYQLQDSISVIKGSHSMKAGIDFRRQEQFADFLPTTRGQLEYATLQNLINDWATLARINTPLRGGERLQYYRYYDYFFFLQDEWRIKPNFTLTYGVRYESGGNPIANLAFYNQRVVAAYGGDERFRLTPVPNRDTNNWAPRVGFNYRFGQGKGILGRLTGDSKLVMRGGYSRTYDPVFNNIALNVGSAFPFVQVVDVPLDPSLPGALRSNAWTGVNNVRNGIIPSIANPLLITRTIVNGSFRAPLAEQVSLQFQRELPGNYAFSIGYVGTKGTALFQTTDGNPTVPGSNGARRQDPTRGVIRERCNCTSSSYHSMQLSLEKRLSRNFSMASHYTWSAFIDGASEIFNPSVQGEIAFPQNPYDRNSDRGRSTYDRPHRFTTNGVFELPFFRQQQGFAGKVFGGWQVNGFLTLQSGAPFTVLNGADPGGVVAGNLVGTSIRPFLNTNLDLSRMTIPEIRTAGAGSLWRAASAAAPIGNSGRNILRANGINRLDLGIIKNTKVREGHNFQFHANFFNTTNSRDWGIPNANFAASAFLVEGLTDGGNRRIQIGLRYVF